MSRRITMLWRSLKIRLRNLKDDLEEVEAFKRIQSHLPPLNFITVHYAYIIVTCMVSSLIFWVSSNPARSISYTDSLFLVVSAMTESGLNTVNLSQMTTFQQFILWFLIVIGSSIFVSIGTVLARKQAFESRFKDLVKQQKAQRRGYRPSISFSTARNTPAVTPSKNLGEAQEPINSDRPESGNPKPHDQAFPTFQNGSPEEPASDLIRESTNDTAVQTPGNIVPLQRMISGRSTAATELETDRISFMPTSPAADHHRVLTFAGVGAHPHSTSFKPPYTGGIYQRGRKSTKDDHEKDEEAPEGWYPHYLTPNTTGRNAQFFGLTSSEREHLGGVEYRAIQLLAWIVPIYFVLWQLLGCLGLGAYMAYNKAKTATDNGINPW